jgi:glycosyltransferase involved in cell wall biosynthesis
MQTPMAPLMTSSRDNISTIAVIPAFEEAGAIGPTVRRLPREVVDHVIVVDGGSADATAAEAEAAGALVIREGRRGYGRACARGAAAAGALGADIVLFLDGDGSDAAERADDIVGPVRRGEADLVLAHRSAAGRARASMGLHQVFAGWAFGRLIGLMTGTTYRDMCAFRALRLETLERLGMTELTYGWNLEMQIRAAAAGLRIREVPLPYGRRRNGHSKVAGNVCGTLRASAQLLAVFVRFWRARRAHRARPT